MKAGNITCLFEFFQIVTILVLSETKQMEKFIYKVIGWAIIIIMVLFATALVITFDINDCGLNIVLGFILGMIAYISKDVIKWFIKGGKI